MGRRPTRRGLLRAAGVGLAGALAGCNTGSWQPDRGSGGEPTERPERSFVTPGDDSTPVPGPKEELYLYPADLPGEGWRSEIYPWAEKAFERAADRAIVGSSVYVYDSVEAARAEWDRYYADDEAFLPVPELDIAVESVRSKSDLFRDDQQQVVFRDANAMGTVRGILSSAETAFADVAGLAAQMHRKWR